MFLKIEPVANWIIRTVSIIYRNVPTSTRTPADSAYKWKLLIVLYTMFGLGMCHLYALAVLSIYLLVHSYIDFGHFHYQSEHLLKQLIIEITS